MFCLIQRINSWKTGKGSNSYWFGGPPTDGNSKTDGSYVFTEDTSEDKSPRAWFITMTLPATEAEGRCIRFSYNINGANNLDKFQLLKVDLSSAKYGDTHGEQNKQDNTTSRMFEPREILRSVEKSSSYQVSIVKALIIF